MITKEELEFMEELAEDYCQCKTPLVNVDKPYECIRCNSTIYL